MNGIEDLIARVKAATGPGWELNVEIEVACADTTYSHGHRPSNKPGKVVCVYGNGRTGTYNPRAYTSSIDDIVSLIKANGLEWLRKSPTVMTVYSPLTDEQEAAKEWAVHYDAAGATPALALCAAFLDALIASGDPS